MCLSKRFVYTHEGTDVELWATPEGLSVRNGKRRKPVVLSIPATDETPDAEEIVAEAFFAGLVYNV